ncbi:MAG: hypothetical protein N3F09_08700 [Bacteroidia bacterium]|nr:hypothetical protein [Bacteroidia bacterium]
MFQETDKKFQETALQIKETDRQLKETDRKLHKLESLFNDQWEKLIEAMVDGELIRLLNACGIPVNGTSQRKYKKYKGREYEFDLMAESDKELVVVKVEKI